MAHLKTTLVILLLTLLFITGCSNKFDISITEVFRNNILDNDAKMFTFSLVFVNHSTLEKNGPSGNEERQRPKQGDKRGDRKGSNDRPNKQSANKRNSLEAQMAKELEERLVERFEENNYCRQGYFELERTFNKSIYTIHGECNESATTEDRQQFIK